MAARFDDAFRDDDSCYYYAYYDSCLLDVVVGVDSLLPLTTSSSCLSLMYSNYYS